MIGSHWFAYNIQTYKGFICEVNNPAGLSVFWNFGMTQFATGKCWCFDDGQFYAVELAVVLSVSCLMEEIGVCEPQATFENGPSAPDTRLMLLQGGFLLGSIVGSLLEAVWHQFMIESDLLHQLD